MAKLTHEDIVQLAKLARLELDEDEVAKLQVELEAILGYVEQLESVDVTGLSPTSQVTGLTNVVRADEVIDYDAKKDKLMKLLPNQQDDYIKVKRMVA